MITPEQQAAWAQYQQESGFHPAPGGSSNTYGAIDQLISQQQESAKAAKPDLLSKAAEIGGQVFPGTKQIGESMGTLGVAAGQAVGAIPGGLKGAYETTKTGPSVPELAGGYASTYGQIGAAALPLPKGASVLSSAAKGAAQMGALGALTAGGQTAAQGASPIDSIKNAFIGGLSGAVVGGAAGAATKGITQFAEKAPEHIYNNALSVSNKLKSVGKSPSAFLADEGVWGSLGNFHSAAETGIQDEGKAIATKVAAKADVPVSYDEIKSAAVAKLSKSLGNLYSSEELGNLVDSVPVSGLKEGAKLPQANNVREQLGSLIGDSKWLQSNPAQNTKAAQAVYGALADKIKTETGTATEFARQSKWLATRKVVQNAIQKADSKYGIGLMDILSGTGGAVAGGLTGQGDIGERVKGALVGGMTGLATERVLTSPALKTGIAQVLTHINDIPTDSAGKISREAVVQLISRLTAGTAQQSSQ